jgi:hypothetical protein
MMAENRQEAESCEKKDLDRCGNGMAMMKKWYGMTVEKKQKEAKENRKEIEMKDKGSGTKGKQKEHRQETERKQKGKGKGKGGKKKWTRKKVEIKQKLIPQ